MKWKKKYEQIMNMLEGSIYAYRNQLDYLNSYCDLFDVTLEKQYIEGTISSLESILILMETKEQES